MKPYSREIEGKHLTYDNPTVEASGFGLAALFALRLFEKPCSNWYTENPHHAMDAALA